LVIDVTHPSSSRLLFVPAKVHFGQTLDYIVANLKPHLGWMKSLQYFEVIGRGRSTSFSTDDPFLSELRKWMLREEDLRPDAGLKRIWIEGSGTRDLSHIKPSKGIQSLLLRRGENVNLNHEDFKQLEHLGGFPFSSLAQLSALKYARGYCIDGQVYFCS